MKTARVVCPKTKFHSSLMDHIVKYLLTLPYWLNKFDSITGVIYTSLASSCARNPNRRWPICSYSKASDTCCLLASCKWTAAYQPRYSYTLIPALLHLPTNKHKRHYNKKQRVKNLESPNNGIPLCLLVITRLPEQLGCSQGLKIVIHVLTGNMVRKQKANLFVHEHMYLKTEYRGL